MASSYTLDEVKKHTALDDCWIVINNNVLNVTDFLNDHPGGAHILLNNSGQDCTELFNDIGHSSSAKKILEKYKIGIAKQ
jgi:cytochrome b involved in lipid metabolism